MRPPDITTLEALYDALDYDPQTGEIRWRTNRRKVFDGDLAGSISRDGALVIGFAGRVYQAHHIAWYFLTGEWPSSSVLFRDRDPMNLLPNNLYLQEDAYRTTLGQRQRMENYRYRLRIKKLRAVLKSDRPNITLDYDQKTWTVRDPNDHRIILGAFDNKANAEAFDTSTLRGRELLRLYPVPNLGDAAHTTYAGSAETISLYDAHRRFVYDPDTGMIHRRFDGTPIIELGDDRRLIVRAKGRVFSAGMLAWFLTRGEWPARKQLGYKDGDQRNIRLANLYLKGPRP